MVDGASEYYHIESCAILQSTRA